MQRLRSRPGAALSVDEIERLMSALGEVLARLSPGPARQAILAELRQIRVAACDSRSERSRQV